MSKRFTDTKKWDDPWFAELPSKYKLFWLYLLDECDHAGIWKVNFRKAQFMIGESLEQAEVFRYLSDRIKKIDETYWLVLKFIDFQYGYLKNDNVSISICKILDKHELTEFANSKKRAPAKGLPSPSLGAKDKDKDKDKVKDKVIDRDIASNKSTYSEEFERAWHMYGRKGSKTASYQEWKKTTQEDKEVAINHIPQYVEANRQEPQYMKDFERYLKNQTYYSAIIERTRKNTFSGGSW